MLHQGQNRLEIWLADGWFRSQMMWAEAPILNCWGDRIAAIAAIVAGGMVTLASDAHWRSGLLPVLKSGISYGEDCNARVSSAETHGVAEIPFDLTLLAPHETAPVRELPPIAPIDQWTDAEGRQIWDFGQNAGATLRFQHAEVLGTDRAFDNRNYRSARAEIVYTLQGGTETCAPIFTFYGFRYARLTVAGQARVTDIAMIPISSVPTLAGGFTCGVPAVNRLVQNTIWSQRSNLIEVPTDCPQRDERLGWTGDAQVFAGTACWLADCESFLAKYLRDVMHDQRADGAGPHFSPDPTRLHPMPGRGDWAGATGWGDAITVIPWQLYLQYGDATVLKDCFPAMLKWLDYLWNISKGPIVRPPATLRGKGIYLWRLAATRWRQPQAAPDRRRRLRRHPLPLHLDRPCRRAV